MLTIEPNQLTITVQSLNRHVMTKHYKRPDDGGVRGGGLQGGSTALSCNLGDQGHPHMAVRGVASSLGAC